MTSPEPAHGATAAPFTRMKLTDVANRAPADSGIEAHFPRTDLGAEQAGVAFHRLAPNVRQPFGHRHEQAEEIFIVIGGSGRMKLDDEIVELERLVVIRVAPTVTRSLEAGPDGLEVIVAGAHHASDGELVPGWWND